MPWDEWLHGAASPTVDESERGVLLEYVVGSTGWGKVYRLAEIP